MNEIVLDASALLALLNDEPGAERVALSLPGVAMSTVNLSEVVGKLAEEGIKESEIRNALKGLRLKLVPFDDELAYECGLMRPSTRPLGLSLGDRACLALGKRLNAKVLTTDSAWKRFTNGPKVEVIR